MDRRTALKSGLLLTGAFTLPNLPIMAMNGRKSEKLNPNRNQGLVLKMNNIEIFLFSDGHVLLENPQPIFAPSIDSKEFNTTLTNIYLSQNGKLDLAVNVMLIKSDNRLILIDSGSGKHFGENEGWLSDSLEKTGIKPEDITDVFI